MDNPLPQSEDSPPPEFPYLHFEPSLQVQRQRAVHDLLRSIASTPRYAGGITRLLDVGCGEASFIRRLIPCDDRLPLEQMTGVDIDDESAKSRSWELLKQPFGDAEERWYGLDIRLLHGSFEALCIESVGYHDAIVSVEVLEHLDPSPHSQFAPTLLGRLKPKICIVTTPNREFNALFDYLENLEPSAPETERYHRDGIPYCMRHHDHRFEWTRQEFRSWALEVAGEFGYDVQFSGVGGLGSGMAVIGRENANDVLREAAEACGNPDVLLKGTDMWGELKGIVGEIDDDDEGVDIVRRVFGDCSQIAVFVLRPEAGPVKEANAPYKDSDGELKLMRHHSYKHLATEEFPPSLEAILGMLMSERLSYLIPELILEEWTKDHSEVEKDMRFRRKYGSTFNPRENVWDQQLWRDLDDKALRETERLFARLGGRTWEVKCVEIVVDAHKLWEGSSNLRRAFHFKLEVFVDAMRNIKAKEKTPETLIENTKMKVELSQEDDKTVVTATFPAGRKPVLKDPWAKPEKLERVIFSEDEDDYGSYEEIDEFAEEFDEFEYAEEPDVFDDEYATSVNGGADAIVLPEPKNPEFRLPSQVKRSRSPSPSGSVYSDHTGGFDTVIEWIAHTDNPRPEHCLPQSMEEEGTLDISNGEPTGQLFRVKFMGPKREIELSDGELQDEEELEFENEEVTRDGSWWWKELEKMSEEELMPDHDDEEEA